MKKIVVISAILSLGLGCAGSLKLGSNSLFNRNKQDGSSAASEGAGGAETASSSGSAAAEPNADPAAERRAYYQPMIDTADELIAKLPQCCQGEGFLLELTSTYPSDQFVKDYKYAWSRKSMRSSDDANTPEWQAVEAKYKALDDALAGAVRLPKDVYKDKDAKQIKKIFAEEAASSKEMPVVEVVLLDEGWNRKSGSEWVGENLVEYDQGFMRGMVVLKVDETKGEVWDYTPRKDWIDGGKVKFDVYVPSKIVDIRLPLAGASK